MGTTAKFNYVYGGSYSGGTFTIENASTRSDYSIAAGGEQTWLAETATTPDGLGFLGEVVSDNFTLTYTYSGRSGNDALLTDGTFYYLYSNNNYADNQQLSIDTADTYPFCFVRGTLIQTPTGPKAVELLQIGDEVLNQAGQAVTVKWLGRQTQNASIAKITGVLPIRIQQGALGEGLPQRDLCVSPDHAMLVDGLLVHASALVNGRTITQVEDWQGPLEYFHIETEAHEIVLAEGAPAETFIDNVSRQTFDNHAEYAALYPNAAPMEELALPRVKFARQLPRAVSDRLATVADGLRSHEALAV